MAGAPPLDWFTISQIDDSTFALTEDGHWEDVHSYLFVGDERAALIDTGTGIADISSVVRTIVDVPVLVVTTHVHWDHIGGHGLFDQRLVHRFDADWLRNGSLSQSKTSVRISHFIRSRRRHHQRFSAERGGLTRASQQDC